MSVKIPTADEVIVDAMKIYEQARDQNRIEAIGTIAKALLTAHEAGGTAVYDHIQEKLDEAILRVATPRTTA